MIIRNRYVFLLCGLLFFLLISPLARHSLPAHAVWIGDIAIALGLGAGIWSLQGSRHSMVWGGLLIATMLLTPLSKLFGASPLLAYTGLSAGVVFCIVTALIALRDVLFGGTLDVNRLMGSVCVYLLIGLAWALMYALVDELTLDPAFTNLHVADMGRTLDEFLYYSFVTLSTLGYGDISPVAPVARTLAYLEATVGQLYLTILVAALVGLMAPRLRSQVESRLSASGTEA